MYGLLRLINLLPYRLQVYVGKMLGFILFHVAGKRRRIAETNLRLCFPELPEEERRKILKQHFMSLGISLFEFGIGYWWSDRRFGPLAHIEGLEHLDRALQKNRGAILLAGHFTTLEIISRVLKLHRDFHPMYRKHNNPLIEHIITSERIRYVGKVIPHDDLRSMIRSLRSNMPVLYIPDQNFGRRHSIFVPFFGIPTATVTATSRIAAIDRTPVVPIVQERLPENRGYRLTIQQELEDFPGDDLEEDITRINRIFEEQIRRNPVDYLWVHRRFKTRPEGESSFYTD